MATLDAKVKKLSDDEGEPYFRVKNLSGTFVLIPLIEGIIYEYTAFETWRSFASWLGAPCRRSVGQTYLKNKRQFLGEKLFNPTNTMSVLFLTPIYIVNNLRIEQSSVYFIRLESGWIFISFTPKSLLI